MLQGFEILELKDLLNSVQALKAEGYRLAAITCEHDNDNFELTYHFDLEYIMKNLRVVVTKEDDLTSISQIYPAAFLIENEFQDLYGLTFKNLTIDYKGHLYLADDAPVTPMLKQK